jgi:RNA polymerase sigma-70 factor (ECF subfamily)
LRVHNGPVRAAGDRGRADVDAALVAGVRRGDAAALEALFRAYATPLREFANRLVHERDVAHELVQDVFLSIWAQRTTWVVRGAVSTYLFRAVKNRALNAVRRERVHRRFEATTERGGEAQAEWITARPAPADALAESRDFVAAIRRALESLPARARAVFRMAREDERRYPEIAEQLGISVPTVERDMAKAVDALKRELAGWREAGDKGR